MEPVHLNPKMENIFYRIVEHLNGGSHCRIENSKGFMALVVERLETHDIGTVFSLCHYYELNGDLCQDPEMCFLWHKSGRVYPMMYQTAIPPAYEESLYLDGGKWKIRLKLQIRHTQFATHWLKNIKVQQDL